MSILNEFTEAMTAYEQSKGIPSGYQPEKGKRYPNYMSNAAWRLFRDGMDPRIESEYGGGSGGELEGTDEQPPKMAAFHSSSRFVYLMSRDCPDFQFEKQLTTVVGGKANLDGFVSRPDRLIFVEAKCREPYGHKSPERISVKYLPVYAYLKEQMPTIFDYTAVPIDDKYQAVTFYCQGEKVDHFDIKQMICHLLAAAAYLLQMDKPVKHIDFLYLLFDPAVLPLGNAARDEILNIHNQAIKHAEGFDFKTMFFHIATFLTTCRNIDADPNVAKDILHFQLCDQHDYFSYLK